MKRPVPWLRRRRRPGQVYSSTPPRSRAVDGYDASNYRVTPAAVAYPRDTEDVAALVPTAADRKLPVISRGSGTSIAGNAIGPGIVLDFARHMNRMLAIDPAGAHRDRAGRHLRSNAPPRTRSSSPTGSAAAPRSNTCSRIDTRST
jgi:hypothetical protein